MKNNKGFTLVEVLTVVLILSILVAIAIPVYSNITQRAARNVLSYNSHSAYIFALLSIGDYDDDHLFSDNYNDTTTLAKFLEFELERLDTPNQSNDYNNKHNFENPYTKSRTILHYKSVSGVTSLYSGTVTQPAVFITNDTKCDPTNLNLSESEEDSLAGTIVIYLRNNQLPVYIYALNKHGDLIEESLQKVYR
ncbi:MAG: prepilin-type N-terminal cleavage/methylation domain-containing protein [Clostridia bacterium]|nr:prepilin-type N-terminal cleavage/methylation domain-containing protein [Clostridia bacterium]